MTAAGATIGKSLLYQESDPACYAGYLVRFRARPEIDPRFISYWTDSRPYWAQLEAGRVVSTIENFSASKYQNLELLIPSRTEQRAIADFLDAETARIDALISRKHSLKTAVDERERALTAAAVEQLVAIHGETPLRRWVYRIEQGWSPMCENGPAEPDTWGVLKTSAVTSGSFVPTANKRLPDGVKPELRWAVLDGDLLITRGSGSVDAVGQAAVARTNGRRLMISDLIYRIVLDGASPDFVAVMLRAPQLRSKINQSIRSDAGQTLKLRGTDILDLLVPAVPQAEQIDTAKDMTRITASGDAVTDRLTRQIALLKERRQALITAAVTGALDVVGAA